MDRLGIEANRVLAVVSIKSRVGEAAKHWAYPLG